MRHILYFVTIIAFAGIMTGLFGNITIGNSIPNIILLFIICLAGLEDSFDFYIPALLGGLILDFQSGLLVGSFMVGCMLCAGLIHLLFYRMLYYQFDWKHVPWITILSFTITMAWLALYNTIALQLRWSDFTVSVSEVRHIYVPGLAYTLLLMYPVYWYTAGLNDFIKRLESRRHTA